MADDSDVGDATEIPDETFSKDFNSTEEVQNNEVFSQVSENIDLQCEDKPAEESSVIEEVSDVNIWKFS